MGRTVLVDTGFLVALLSRRDRHHTWAAAHVAQGPRPWVTCEAVLSEAFYLLGDRGRTPLGELLRRDVLIADFDLHANRDAVLDLMEKYANVPMSLADGCLVRMSEIVPDPVVLTTDADFQRYRRHGRQVVPCVRP